MGFVWNDSVGAVAERAVRGQVGRTGFLALAEAAKELMEPFVPMDTGALVKSARVEADETRGRVVYDVPYAAAVYYGAGGATFSREKHPLATAFWDRAAQTGDIRLWQK